MTVWASCEHQTWITLRRPFQLCAWSCCWTAFPLLRLLVSTPCVLAPRLSGKYSLYAHGCNCSMPVLFFSLTLDTYPGSRTAPTWYSISLSMN